MMTVRARSADPRAAGLVVACAAAAAIAYLWWAPDSPDLAAQLARADLVRRVGNVSWWTGWFGGLSLPSYSVLAPWWMAVLGVRATGAFALVFGSWAGALLMRDTSRPRAGAAALAIAEFADLLAGRVTFVVGFAIGAWSLVALRNSRPRLAVATAVAAFLTSPLAGLFLGLVLLAAAAVDRARRRDAALTAGVLLAVAGTMAAYFPGTGVMPFRPSDMIPPALACIVVVALCPQRSVRAAAVMTLLAMPVFFVLPGAVGGNIARLPWVCAAPVVVACAHVNRRWLAAAVAAVAAWPISDVVRQVAWVDQRSNHASYYRALTDELARERAGAGVAETGERLEVVDTINHAASVHLVSSIELARGWDRQADNADDPIFYKPGTLTAASYHDWLHGLAVGWIAVPSAALDYAAVNEARLIRTGLPYLRQTWSDRDWTLYRVIDATTLAIGATVRAVAPSGITLSTAGAATIDLRVRWSAYLRLVDAATGEPVTACVADAGGWTRIYVSSAGTYTLISRFDPGGLFRDDDCTENAASS